MADRNHFGLMLASIALLAMVAWTVVSDSQAPIRVEQVPSSSELPDRDPARVSGVEQDSSGTQSSIRQVAGHAGTRQVLPTRRGEFDALAMPFPFTGRCVADGRAVAGATVHYKGETRTTDQHGRFAFPSFGEAMRVVVEADGYGQLVARSTGSKMVLRMQPPAIGRVIVRDSSELVEGAEVTVYLLPELADMKRQRVLLRDLPVVGKQSTDARGFAFFRDLPTFDGQLDSYGLLYCVIEFPNGLRHEDFLIPRKESVSRGEPRIEWSRDYRRGRHAPPNVRVEQRDESGRRVAVANQPVYYRVNSSIFTPWHLDTTDLLGEIEVKETDVQDVQVVVPISKVTQWNSNEDPLIKLGSVLLALIENRQHSIRLMGTGREEGLSFQVQRMAELPEGIEHSPFSLHGLIGLSEWGWQDCKLGESVQLVSGWAGKDKRAWVRVQPGNHVIDSKPLAETGHTDIRLPELSRLTVIAGEGQRFPLGARVALEMAPANKLPPIMLDPRGSNLAQAAVPYGVYRVALVMPGSSSRTLGNLRIDAEEQEYQIEFPQATSKLELSLGPHLLADFEFRVDHRAKPYRTDERGERALQGTQGDSFFVELSAAPKLAELELPGRPELLFLGYEAHVPFAQEGMFLSIPLGSLYFEANAQDGDKLRISRRTSAGKLAAWAELPLRPNGSVFARTLPVGHYQLKTKSRALEVEIQAVGRVQVDARDR